MKKHISKGQADVPFSSSKFSGELPDNATGKDRHFSESGDGLREGGRPAILKAYLRGAVRICVKIRCWAPQGNRKDFRAIFRNLPGRGVAKACNGDAAGKPLVIKGSDCDLLPDLGKGGDDQEEPVFVSDVQIMHDRQNVIVRRGMLVRLQECNPICGGLANALYVSTVTGLFEFVGATTDGKLMGVIEGRLPVASRKSNNQVVKTGSEL